MWDVKHKGPIPSPHELCLLNFHEGFVPRRNVKSTIDLSHMSKEIKVHRWLLHRIWIKGKLWLHRQSTHRNKGNLHLRNLPATESLITSEDSLSNSTKYTL
jgi:hypothetical protein